MMFNFVPPLMRQFGGSNVQIGLLTTIYFVVSIFSSPLMGGLSDLLENRKIIPLISSVAMAGVLVAISYCTIPLHLLVIQILIGILFPALYAPLLALISDKSRSQSRGSDMGWFNAFRGVGSMISLLGIGYLTVYLQLLPIFRYVGLFYLILVIPILLLPEKLSKINIPEASQLLSEIKSRLFPKTDIGSSLLYENGLIFLYISLALRAVSIVGFSSFLSVLITDEFGYSLRFLSTFSAVGSGLTIFGMLTAGYAADIIGRKHVINIGLFLAFLAPLSYSLGGDFSPLLWLGRIGHSISYSFIMSGSAAFVGDIARKREQGALLGWVSMAVGIGGTIGPIIMGAVLETLGYLGAALFFSLFALSATILTIFKVEETT